MKIGHWVAIAAEIYLLGTAIDNFMQGTLPVFNSLPDLGQTITGNIPGSTPGTGTTSSGMAGSFAGLIDLGAAAAVYFFFLHGKL